NGAGKTTLFRIIARELEPDLGTVTISRDIEIGYLKQDPNLLPHRTLFEEVGSVFEDLLALEKKLHLLSDQIAANAENATLPDLMIAYERVNAQFITAGGHKFETRLHECLGGLGFSNADYGLPVSVLSGGQKSRVALAKLLLQERPLLLMDEPTNHLDIDAVRWLEKFLAGHQGGAIIISHDRYLLDRLCNRIVEIDAGRAYGYPGNYSRYVETKQRRELTAERQFEKDQTFIDKERAFIAKHGAGQRSKEARGRKTRLERRMGAGEFITNAPSKQRSVRLEFSQSETTGGTSLRCDDLIMAFGEQPLFRDLTFQVRTGERFGITGPNGTGKSTLLKIIVGQLSPVSGSVTLSPRLRVGYFSQDAAALEPTRLVLDEIRATRPDLSEQLARSILGRFLFRGNDAFKPLGALSGGEQSRIRLINLILSEPDLMILDEPTNHLDIPSREALEEALTDFPGTILVVSHDRYFLDRVVDRLLVIRPTQHAIYAGNYTFYVEQTEKIRGSERVEDQPTKQTAKATRKPTNPSKVSSPYDHLSVAQLEAKIIERETELAVLHARFGDAEVYKDPDRLAELQEKTEEIEAELSQLNEAWDGRLAN
ncbi:MAG: ABC-F family ATP-binding cassette domain-containing protein, partial [Planctomycetota bacterium]